MLKFVMINLGGLVVGKTVDEIFLLERGFVYCDSGDGRAMCRDRRGLRTRYVEVARGVFMFEGDFKIVDRIPARRKQEPVEFELNADGGENDYR